MNFIKTNPFQQSFSYITTVAACCIRRDSTRILNAANTDAPCCRHKTQMHHPVNLFWHRAYQSCLYLPNAERLARKQPEPVLTILVRRGRRSNPRPPDCKANAFTYRSPLPVMGYDKHKKVHVHVYWFNTTLLKSVDLVIHEYYILHYSNDGHSHT